MINLEDWKIGRLEDWKIGGDRSRNKIWTKTTCLDMATFLPNLGKKSKISRFGRELAAV
jgi:hypothetical protein